MNTAKLGLRIASLMVGLFGLGHLLRLITQLQISVAGRTMPLWPSALIAIVCGALAGWLWNLSRPGHDDPSRGAHPPHAKV